MDRLGLVPVTLRYNIKRAVDALSRVGGAVSGGRARAGLDGAAGAQTGSGAAPANQDRLLQAVKVIVDDVETRRTKPDPSPPDGISPSGSQTATATSFAYLKQMLYDTLAQRRKSSTNVPSTGSEPKAKRLPVLTAAERIKRARALADRRLGLERRTRELAYRLLYAVNNLDTPSRGADGGHALLAVQELCMHFLAHPKMADLAEELRLECVLCELLSSAVRSQSSPDSELACACRVALALVGNSTPPAAPGIRLLAIDGGGTRGTMSLEILETLEKHLGGRKIHEVFDMCIGVSTGAIICTLLAGYRMEVAECKRLYWEMSARLFTQDRFSGVRGLIWSHSYYSTAEWIALLKETFGTRLMVDTAKKARSPKLAIVSCVVNTPKMEAFVFRNYTHRWHEGGAALPGSSTHAAWQALQASAAAPGYFEEVCLDNLIHQDGGVLVNNPTLVGLQEARALWPSESIQCVVSIGNGRSVDSVPQLDISWNDANEGVAKGVKSTTGLSEKIIKIVDSATDTEMTHCNATTLLPSGQYYRLNPYMQHAYSLDEIDPKRLAMMRDDAKMYIRRNESKIEHVAKVLLKERSFKQKAQDWAKLQALLKLDVRF